MDDDLEGMTLLLQILFVSLVHDVPSLGCHSLLTAFAVTFDNDDPAAESAVKSFLAGGVGGACVVLVGHPLDLIKVRASDADTDFLFVV